MQKAKKRVRGGASLRQALRDKGRKRREGLIDVSRIDKPKRRNDLLPKLELVYRRADELALPARKLRATEQSHIRAVMHAISVAGFIDPVLIDETNVVWDGQVRAEAARQLNLQRIPCILAKHLSLNEKRLVRLALNRLGEKGSWALSELKTELVELVELGLDIEDTGFTLAEFDQIILDDEAASVEQGTLVPNTRSAAIAEIGDVFIFDQLHRLICGDATNSDHYTSVMTGEHARLILTDEPFNVRIAGHVTKGEHREFVMASGEMSDAEFLAFNSAWIQASVAHLCDGGLIGTFIDWRGYPTVHSAAAQANLTAVNLVVWAKSNAGLGSLYRSQHELLPLFKKGIAAHVNNVELGKNGRYRSNVWSYPGASSIHSDSREGLAHHPTVKPSVMLADAMLDLSNRGEIVLDPFMGSGSSLIAAQSVGRRCFGVELDPSYVDVAVQRYQEVYGPPVILEATGETFEELASRRRGEGA